MDIDLTNISKSYRRGDSRVEVLRDLSLSLASGSFNFVIGPSGSGKSTLLYLMGALDDPDEGSVRLGEFQLSELQGAERDRFRRGKVGFIFQSFNLLKNLTAVDNVLVPYMPEGKRSAMRGKAVELLEKVGLGHRLDHHPNELSGGEQQRVAIARALLKQPELVLADEPTGELDSKTGAEIMNDLRTLHAEHGSTVVVVTHDRSHIKPGDRLHEIKDGSILESTVTA